MVYVRTCAYNAEKTLERAIESILNQTYGEFVYYILDNGSTDGTRDIIKRYAEKDKRIVPFYNEKNHDYTQNTEFWNMFYCLREEDYLCILDADDAYEVSFLEEMLCFIKENKLDIAMCGSTMLDAEKWTPLGDRVLSRNIVIETGSDFEEVFPVLYWNLRAIWGKLYSAKAARLPYTSGKGLPEWYPRAYGGDTVNVFGSVEMAERIGVLARPLHLYAISQKSVSYHWGEGREKSDPLLFYKAEELLIKKSGRVSENNYRMLYAVYFNAVSDTLRVLFESQLEAERKVCLAHDIIFHPITQKMFVSQFDIEVQRRVDFFVYVVIKLLSLYKRESGLPYTTLEEILTNINPDYSKLITEENSGWYLENHPIVLRNVALREYEYAVNNLMVYLSKEEARPEKEFPYILGQQLSALREEEDKYIFFSKHLIRWYIMNGQEERAKAELEEWIAILPEDDDLKKLQSLL